MMNLMEEDLNRLRTCIRAMKETLATNDDPDISLITDYFKETFEIRRNFVKTHNTTEILAEYPALQLHSCVSQSNEMKRLFQLIFSSFTLVIGRFSYANKYSDSNCSHSQTSLNFKTNSSFS